MNPTLNDSPEWEVPPPASPPVPPPPPARLERVLAHHVGNEARVIDGNPKLWAKGCWIQRACGPFKALRKCDANLSALDPLANFPADREGQVVALRGTLALSSLATTAMACRQQPHAGRGCCNQVGCGAVIQYGDTAVLLDKLGCRGDDSRVCCDTPAFGEAVVAVGKLVRAPGESSGIEWRLDDPRLCSEAP
jgi:hypothetical protein